MHALPVPDSDQVRRTIRIAYDACRWQMVEHPSRGVWEDFRHVVATMDALGMSVSVRPEGWDAYLSELAEAGGRSLRRAPVSR